MWCWNYGNVAWKFDACLCTVHPALLDIAYLVGARLCFYTCVWFCSQGGVLSQHALQVVSQHALQKGGSPPGRGVPGRGVSSWGGAWSQGGLLLGGGLVPGGLLQGGAWWRPPPDGYCCGQYASYWNVFLYKQMFLFRQENIHMKNWSCDRPETVLNLINQLDINKLTWRKLISWLEIVQILPFPLIPYK